MTLYYAKLDGTIVCNSNRVAVGTDDTDFLLMLPAVFIYCVQIGYNGKDTEASTYQLMWKATGGEFANVASTGAIKYSADSVLSNGGTVTGPIGTGKTARCAAQSGETWADLAETECEDGLTGSINLGSDSYTEIQFGLSCADATPGTTYEFQLYGVAQGAALSVEGGAYAKIKVIPTSLSATAADCVESKTQLV